MREMREHTRPKSNIVTPAMRILSREKTGLEGQKMKTYRMISQRSMHTAALIFEDDKNTGR